MKKEDRHQLILREADIHNRILLVDVAKMLDVSIDTARRDIKELDEVGALKKVHGGAISNGYHSQSNSKNGIYQVGMKSIVAHKAAKLVENQSAVLMSGGTTNVELVKALPKDLSATFFTPSLQVAIELMSHPSIEVVFIGGKMSKESQFAIGGSAINTLNEISFDSCFLGTGYLDPEYGLTEFDWEIVQMKKAMVNASKRIVSLTISEKLNSNQRYKICDIQGIDVLITELDPSADLLKPYQSEKTEII